MEKLRFVGLKDNPEIKAKLLKTIEKINAIAHGDNMHLSDVGCLLAMYAKEIVEVSDKSFELHKIEKDAHYKSLA